jgi:hypothetical protein
MSLPGSSDLSRFADLSIPRINLVRETHSQENLAYIHKPDEKLIIGEFSKNISNATTNSILDSKNGYVYF